MRIRTDIIERINGRRDIKNEIIKAFNTTRMTLWRWLNENEPDGPLTTVKSLAIISESLKINQEEILTD